MWGRSFSITRLGGFDIKVDASWFLIAALIIWSLSTGYFPQILPDASGTVHLVAAVLAMLGLFASLVLHELSHSVVARRHGLRIAGITLFLFGGVAELETEPADPDVEFRVAVVGPLASLALAAFFWVSEALARDLGLGAGVTAILGYLAAINLTLALFNLIPAFPLDGGRVYRALLWRSGGDLLTATRRAANVSAAFAWGLVALGAVAVFTSGPGAGLWPILLGLFLLALARGSYRQVEMQQVFSGKCVADLMTREAVVVHPGQTLSDVVNGVFLAEGIGFAPVVEAGVLLGYVDIHLIRRIDREHWDTATVDDVFETVSDENTVLPDMPVAALVERISRGGRRKFLVVEGGVLRGVVTLSDVGAYLDVSRQIAAPV